MKNVVGAGLCFNKTFKRIKYLLVWCDIELSGRVPTLQEGNQLENIFSLPWSRDRPIVIGNCH